MKHRKAFGFIDVIATIGILAFCSVALIRMTVLAYGQFQMNAAACAMYRGMANFNNVFALSGASMPAEGGECEYAYAYGKNGAGGAFISHTLSIADEGAYREFSMTVETFFAPGRGAAVKDFSRTCRIRRPK